MGSELGYDLCLIVLNFFIILKKFLFRLLDQLGCIVFTLEGDFANKFQEGVFFLGMLNGVFLFLAMELGF